jgi:hypothetical protein
MCYDWIGIFNRAGVTDPAAAVMRTMPAPETLAAELALAIAIVNAIET